MAQNASDLKKALELTGISIKKYDPNKIRPVYSGKASMSVERFSDILMAGLGKNLVKFPDIVKAFGDAAEMTKQIAEYAESENLIPVDPDGDGQISIPKELSHLTLNIDRSSKEGGGKRFFCTTPEELVDPGTSGQYFLDKCGASPIDGAAIARSVIPRYMPRRPRGIMNDRNEITNTSHDFYNTYIPPEWELWKNRNPQKWNKLPAKPPEEIIRFIKHLIPNKNEREYLYAWMHTSMTGRSFVYLVLCGNPGVGKNRLKIILRAIHGGTNSVDGKKETFGANENKFNSQMRDNTMMWFDELKYGPDMEPRMKEYQNTNISIENKGVDATKSTEIFSSMVISNNYPRDNYLLFNSRKFAPLVLGDKPLTAVMTSEEIATMSDRLDNTTDKFDVMYAAQIAKWILSIGAKYAKNFPNLEYQGPKYWELAHTSMSRWQKITVLSLTTQTARGPFPGWNATKGAFLWSEVETALRRKKEFDSKDYRDASTVKAFFENYRDTSGKAVFEVESVPNSIIQDFWIKPLDKLTKVSGAISVDSGKRVDEIIKDLKDTGGKPGPSKNITEALIKNLVRPPGMSDFKWRKLKEEQEKLSGGKSNGKKDIDDL